MPFCAEHLVGGVNAALTQEARDAFWREFEALLRTLTFRERKVIGLLYGFEDEFWYTDAEVARIFKVTAAEIQRIEEDVTTKLNHPVRAKVLAELCKTFFRPLTTDAGSASSGGVMLQSVVIPGEKAKDEQLIVAAAIPWFMIVRMIEKDPALIYQIDPRTWEELIAGWYIAAGFDEVVLTPRSGDLGRDVIAVKRGIVTVRVIDQVKAYGPEHRVPADDVRALLGVLQSDRGATKGYVTTTSEFAPAIKRDEFIAPFIPYRLELIDRTKLLERLQSGANNVSV